MGTTMSDIAKAAGVSVATVGRVVHDNGYVSRDARERIEKAIADLGYVPDRSARILKSQKSGIIGSLVVQNPNSLYYRINDSIQNAARANGYELLTMEAQPLRRTEGELIKSFIGLHVDGLVITSDLAVTDEQLAQLRQAKIPVVAVERGYIRQGIDSLLVMDREACREAAGGIAGKGHERIAFIGMAPIHEVERLRLEGYLAALEGAGLPERRDLIRLLPDYGAEGARRAAEELFALPDPPTAVFCAADTLAAGVLQAAYARGMRVPEDLSLVGYDDVLSRLLSPPIDSVGLLLDHIGEQVMAMLKRRMENWEIPAACGMIGTAYQDRGTVRELDNKR